MLDRFETVLGDLLFFKTEAGTDTGLQAEKSCAESEEMHLLSQVVRSAVK